MDASNADPGVALGLMVVSALLLYRASGVEAGSDAVAVVGRMRLVAELRDLRANWEAFGKQDPLWAVLSLPGKRFGRWGIDEFLQTGVAEVADLMRRLDAIGYPRRRERALDFGCGVGRLTQALAQYFAQVVGVDIARTMLDRARRLNRFPSRCTYVHNDRRDLQMFPDDHFDLIYSAYVLQHIAPEYGRDYVAEFIRVLRPEGVAVFQMPRGGRSSPPLPATAFRGRVAIASRAPPETYAGSRQFLRVEATNLGDAPWPAYGRRSVHVGNHWTNAKDGDVVVQDDGRASFTEDLAPGDSEVITLEVRAPTKPGPYLLDIDLVQEEVAWFAERGLAAQRQPVRVKRGWPHLPVGRTTEQPHMEMHMVSPEEIRRWIEYAGGRLVVVWPLFSAGAEVALKEWDILTYVAARSESPPLNDTASGVTPEPQPG